MKHVFILNPAAGKGLAVNELLPRLHRLMKESDLEYELHRSLSKSDIGFYVRQHAESGENIRFYACGGDGTLNDVLCGMIGFPNAQLACMPYGSGNDFVKNFTKRENFLNIEKQINGSPVPVDVIQFNDSYCINMLNIGTDCDIAIESEKMRERGIKGPASYMAAALKVLPNVKNCCMCYKDENGVDVCESVLLVAVGNGRFCGGGFKGCPKASISDGLMDIGIITPPKGSMLLKLLMKFRGGTHITDKDCSQYVTYRQLSEFALSPQDSLSVSVDGEIEPFHETHFKVLPKAINFSIPLGSEPL